MGVGDGPGGVGPVTRILDLPSDAIAAHYLADARPPHDGRPWVVMGMISSLDGSAVVDGGSTALGGPPDRQVFRALRAAADVIVVGAGTVRSERYRAAALPDDLRDWRNRRGMSDNPRIAIVTESLQIDPTDSLAAARPLVFTTEASAGSASAGVDDWAEVVTVGASSVDPPQMLAHLSRSGVHTVLVEGGPRLNGALADYVDEVCLTVSPTLAGGEGPRIVHGPPAGRTASLDRVVHSEGFLLLRYLFG